MISSSERQVRAKPTFSGYVKVCLCHNRMVATCLREVHWCPVFFHPNWFSLISRHMVKNGIWDIIFLIPYNIIPSKEKETVYDKV